MKRLLLLFTLLSAALTTARSQTTFAEPTKHKLQSAGVNLPNPLSGNVTTGWSAIGDSTIALKFELFGKPTKTITFSPGGNYVLQNGSAVLDQLTFNGGFMKYKPPTGNQFNLGLFYNPATGTYDFRADPVSASSGGGPGLRPVASAPVHSTDPGTAGDYFIDDAAQRIYEFRRRINGTSTWYYYNGVTNFNSPADLPSAPILSGNYAQGQVVMSWSHPGGVTGFELFRSTGNPDNFGLLPNAIFGDARNFIDRSAGEGLTHYYRIRAYNPSGTSGFSNVWSVTTQVQPLQRQLVMNTHIHTAGVDSAVARHMTAICFHAQWKEINPSPGVYTFTALNAAVNYAIAQGLKVAVNVYFLREFETAGPQPDGYFATSPASGGFEDSDLMYWSDGSQIRINPVVTHYSVIPTLTSSRARAARSGTLAALAQNLKAHHAAGKILYVSGVIGSAGELSYPWGGNTDVEKAKWSDYSAPTVAKFRDWLAARYSGLPGINAAWGTSYGSLGQIQPALFATTSNLFPTVDTESKKDWMRFRMVELRGFLADFNASVKAVAPIPCLVFLSEFGSYIHNYPFASTNLALFGSGFEAVYSSAGSSPSAADYAKTSVPDIVKGTHGAGVIAATEIDDDDTGTFFVGGAWTTTDAGVAKAASEKFFAHGGEWMHITDLGHFPWNATRGDLQYLKNTYCSPGNNTPAARNPQASGTYTMTDLLLGGDDMKQRSVWNSLSGTSRQVDIKHIDDFTGYVAPPVVLPPSLTLSVSAYTSGGAVGAARFGVQQANIPGDVFIRLFGGKTGEVMTNLGNQAALAQFFNPGEFIQTGFTYPATYKAEVRATLPGGEVVSNQVVFSFNASGVFSLGEAPPTPTLRPTLSYRKSGANSFLDWSYSGPQTAPLSSAIIQRKTGTGSFGDWGGTNATDATIPITLPGAPTIQTYRLRYNAEAIVPPQSEWSNEISVNSAGQYFYSEAPYQLVTDPQPSCTGCTVVPRLVTTENNSSTPRSQDYPTFTTPFLAFYFGDGSAQVHLDALRTGFSHVDSKTFLESGKTANGKAVIGADVPYTRRARMMYENALLRPGSVRWKTGFLPLNTQQEQDIQDDVTEFFGGNAGAYNDGKVDQVNLANFEFGPYPGSGLSVVDQFEDLRRTRVLLPLRNLKGTGPWASNSLFAIAARPIWPSWSAQQDLTDRLGYFKPILYTSAGYEADFGTYPAQNKEFWEKQGSWVWQLITNTEITKAQGLPRPGGLIAPYHERFQGYADNAANWKYYKLRPDVIEGCAIWPYATGAEWTALWNFGRRAGEWYNSEEAFRRGLYRINEIADVLKAADRQYIVPEWSSDGGTTYQKSRHETGIASLVGGSMGEESVNGLSGDANEVRSAVDAPGGFTITAPTLPRRIWVRGVVGGGKIALFAQDAWEWTDAVTRDIKIRWNGVVYDVRLHGRKISIVKKAL